MIQPPLRLSISALARLLRGAVSARAVTELHLHALDLQLKSLARRRAVLRVLLRDGEDLTFERLQRLQVLASVDERDRAGFVRNALAARLRGTRHAALGAAVRRAADVELPEDATDAQIEAWLELAEMVGDESFLARHRTRSRKTRGAGPAEMSVQCAPSADAVARGVSPSSAEGRAIVARWMSVMITSAGVRRRRDARSRARDLLAAFERGRDTREERFWTLVALLNPQVARSPITIAWPWLMEGLRGLAEAPERPGVRAPRP